MLEKPLITLAQNVIQERPVAGDVKLKQKDEKGVEHVSPLPYAEVYSITTTTDGKEIRKLEKTTESNGSYSFKYPSKFLTLKVEKGIIYTSITREIIDLDKEPTIQTIYLEFAKENVQLIFKAQNFIAKGDLESGSRTLNSLVNICRINSQKLSLDSFTQPSEPVKFANYTLLPQIGSLESEPTENKDCALIRQAKKALDAGDAATAQDRLEELVSLISPFNFRSQQSMYIVAFRQRQLPAFIDSAGVIASPRVLLDTNLDAERKIRKGIEEWGFFKIAEKLNEADFVFLVNLDEQSMEALAIPLGAYRKHFKEIFDIDSLRNAAYGRYTIGPLKVATLGRLSDRLVKQFREKLKNH